ncbi:MAG: hypothetical protein KGR25_10300 [Chloroflexi bacterium]|nr:hypothetical protein [Chloroflexota bacterium]
MFRQGVSRTNTDLPDDLVQEVMQAFGLPAYAVHRFLHLGVVLIHRDWDLAMSSALLELDAEH